MLPIKQINLYLIILTFALLPFNKVAEIPFSILAIQGLVLLCKNFKELIKNPVSKTFVIFFLCTFIPCLLSSFFALKVDKALSVPLNLLRCLFAGLTIIQTVTTKEDRQNLLKASFHIIAFWIIACFIQGYTEYSLLGNFDPGRGRVGGIFTKQPSAGYLLGFLSPLILIPLMEKPWHILYKILGLAITTVALLQTGGRGGFIMFSIAAFTSLLYLWPKDTKVIKRLVLTASVLLVAGSLLGLIAYKSFERIENRVDDTLQVFNGDFDSFDDASSGRATLWTNSWKCFMQNNKIIGMGGRNLRYNYEILAADDDLYKGRAVAHPHHVYLEYLFETGFIGLVTLLFSLAFLTTKFFRASTYQKLLAAPFALAFFVEYFPVNSHKSHFSSHFNLSLWLITALFIATLSIKDTQEAS